MRRGMFWWSLVGWLLAASIQAQGQTHSQAQKQTACTAQVLAVQAAPAVLSERQSAYGASNDQLAMRPGRPVTGWQDVQLPNDWRNDWSDPPAALWYRIDWQRRCTDSGSVGLHDRPLEPVALGIDGIRLAGEVYSNSTLLWRDASLQEPLSRSWNTPRWWILPESSLQAGVNSVWVRVVSVPELSTGLGDVRLGSVEQVSSIYKERWWRQRTVYMLTIGMALAIGSLFLVVWLLRKSEQSFGWYALASLSWAAYLGTLLVTTSQPWQEALTWSRLNIAFFAVYIGSLCMFMWRFGQLRFPRLERLLWWAVGLAAIAALGIPPAGVRIVFASVWFGFVLVFMLSCLQFQWHAWRPRPAGRNRLHVFLAVCWLLLLAVAIHDALLVLNQQPSHQALNPMVGPIATFLMAMLVGWQLAQGMRRIERFNEVLEARVSQARDELQDVLTRTHAQALENVKLQERVQIAHDLHDGLGGTLVRGLAWVEQAPGAVPKERMLSMLKNMRDDLRQVIDHGSGSAALTPESPLQWIAPVRHRFTRILDELNVVSRWRIAPAWQDGCRPTAVQCLGLTRLVEEALSNVIKHSRARHVRVSVLVEEDAQQEATLAVYIEDDGIGFDVGAVQKAGLSVGLRSMAARAERMGAVFYVESGPSGTSVCAVAPIANTTGSITVQSQSGVLYEAAQSAAYMSHGQVSTACTTAVSQAT